MKKLFIAVVVLALAGMAYAASSSPSKSTSNSETYSRSTTDVKFHTYTIANGYVTSAKNDTVVISVAANEDGHIGKDWSTVTLFTNFLSNSSVAADSGDVVMKVLIGTDSAAYYSPLFTVHDTIEASMNDSLYAFNKWTVQPSGAGNYLALPLTIPSYDVWTRIKLIFSSARTKSGDTIFLRNRQLNIRRLTNK